ncbi:hypothetical protein BH24ACI1_BH24ACI1_10140 [soil metagenome]|jgi:DNA (cytosine-5)-methyltransferase 1
MENENLKFVDLFCSLGGFRAAAEKVGRDNNSFLNGVFSCDFDAVQEAVWCKIRKGESYASYG